MSSRAAVSYAATMSVGVRFHTFRQAEDAQFREPTLTTSKRSGKGSIPGTLGGSGSLSSLQISARRTSPGDPQGADLREANLIRGPRHKTGTIARQAGPDQKPQVRE